MYSKFDENHADIIIVGAGLSGLSAAFYLLKKEPTLNIMIFEGNDRIGGRIACKSVTVNNDKTTDCDLGGQFFVRNQIPLINLLEDLNIEFEESKTSIGQLLGAFSLNDVKKSSKRPPLFGNVIIRYEFIKFFAELEQLSERVQLDNAYEDPSNESYDNITMEEYINKKLIFSVNRLYLKNFLKVIYGLKANEVSLLYYVAYCHSTFGIVNQIYISNAFSRKCWINEGASSVCNKLAEEIGNSNIFLNQPVKKIRNCEDYVLIKTNAGYYKCGYAVVAAPPNEILNIHFQPQLPQKKIDYIMHMKHGTAIKFVATYEKAFWKTRNLSGDIFFNYESSPLLACFNMETCKTPAICGYINPYYEEDIHLSYETIVLRELSKYFGKQALSPLSYAEKDWSNEYYCGGTPISVPGINKLGNFTDFVKPFGRIHWAGAETSSYCYGQMAGAVQSGYVSAFEILYEMRPQTLTTKDFALLRPETVIYKFYRNHGGNSYLQMKCIAPIGFVGLLLFMIIRKWFKNR